MSHLERRLAEASEYTYGLMFALPPLGWSMLFAAWYPIMLFGSVHLPFILAHDEAFGAKGIRLEEPGDVKEALTEALAYKDGPVVVDAVVDPFALSLPSHVPFHTAKGYTLSLAKQVVAGRFDDVIKTMERNVRLV
jgi:hypothetical protein